MVALSPTGERKVVELESFFFQNGRIVMKIAGCDTIEAAQRVYRLCTSVLPEAERVPLAEGDILRL